MKIIDGTTLNATTFNRLRMSAFPTYTIWNDSSTYRGESLTESGADYEDTDLQTVFDDVLDILTSGGNIHFAQGSYTGDVLTVDEDDITLSGCGNSTKFIPTGNNHVFELQAPLKRVTLKDFMIDDSTSNSQTSTAGIYLDHAGAVGQILDCDLQNIIMDDVWDGVDSPSKANTTTDDIKDLTIDNLKIQYRGEGMHFYTVHDLCVSNSKLLQPAAASSHGFVIENSTKANARLNNIKAHGVTTTNGYGFRIAACTYISASNLIADTFDYGLSTTASACDFITLNNIILNNNDSYGLNYGHVSGTVKTNGLVLDGNATAGIYCSGGSSCRGEVSNVILDDEVSIAAGAELVTPFMPTSASLDLSGGATDIDVFHATSNAYLCGYYIFYTEASSADAGVSIDVGRYTDGVALDDDFYDTTTSEVSKNLGYSLQVVTSSLSQTALTEGSTLTVGTAGGKVGTGEVQIVLQLIPVYT